MQLHNDFLRIHQFLSLHSFTIRRLLLITAEENEKSNLLMMIERQTKLRGAVQCISSERKDAAIPRQQLPNLISLMYMK